MKVTAKPVKRYSYSLKDKAVIAIEAYSRPRNVKPTARKFNVQTKQIRSWIDKGIVELYNKHLVPVPVHTWVTDAVRANQTDDFGLDTDNRDVESSIIRQDSLEHQKRYTTAFRLKGGGRKAIMSRGLLQQLRGFVVEMRNDEYPLDMETMICQAQLFDPECKKDCNDDAFRQRMYRVMNGFRLSYRRGTHKAQIKRLYGKAMKDFHCYIKLKCEMLQISNEAVYNFDETNVYFSPHIDYSWTVKGDPTVGIKERKSSQRCTAMLGSSMTGEKAPPYLIYTGADTRTGRIRQELERPDANGYPNGMEYGVQKADGWMRYRC